jgi:glycosyltransferase involved in cell wall biosynthesis
MKRLTIVVPCYNEEEVVTDSICRLTSLLDSMTTDALITSDSRLLLVDDGSCDSTWTEICQAHDADKRICGLKLAANVGHQRALLAGLIEAKEFSDILISIDADLQDDINVIPQMVKLADEGFDIVYGVRKRRASDTFFKRNTALLFYKLMQRLDVKTVYNHADFRLMTRRAVDQLSHYRERNLFLRGIVPLIGYRSASVYYDRKARQMGTSKYPFRKMLNFAIDGITSFSVRPVRMIALLGVLFLIISLFILIYVLHSYITGHVVSGWTSVILSIWLVGGFILIGLGVVGEYIGKIYIEVKDRPRYNVEKRLYDDEKQES